VDIAPPAESETVEAPTAARAVGAVAFPEEKRRTSRSLVALLVVALAGAGLFGAYKAASSMGIRIPFVSDFLDPLPPEPGNLKLATLGVKSRFEQNANLGQLLVVTGMVRNDYDHPRHSVRLVGKLFAQGKELVSTQAVYAGNVLSATDLSALDGEALRQRLNKPMTRVEAGQTIPFMILFSDLPENLAEFTVEVASSSR
jgi:hypothetical protein